MADIENSKMQLRSVVAIIGAMAAATTVLAGGLWQISKLVNGVQTKIDSLSGSIEDVKTNSYTLSKASEQALRFAIENPGMRVPDPRDPNRIIVVIASKSSGDASTSTGEIRR